MKAPSYLDPACRLTLRQAIAELREFEGVENDAAAQVAAELSNDLDVHDVIHVIFGCETNVAGEVLAHGWTIFGTRVSMHDLHRVNMHADHRQALRQIGHLRLLRTWVLNLPLILKTIYRARRMKRLLDPAEFPSLMDWPLVEIRSSLGVQLDRPPSDFGDRRDSLGAAVRHVRRPLKQSS